MHFDYWGIDGMQIPALQMLWEHALWTPRSAGFPQLFLQSTPWEKLQKEFHSGTTRLGFRQKTLPIILPCGTSNSISVTYSLVYLTHLLMDLPGFLDAFFQLLAIVYKESGSKAWLWDISALEDLLWEKKSLCIGSLSRERTRFCFFILNSLVHLKEAYQLIARMLLPATTL